MAVGLPHQTEVGSQQSLDVCSGSRPFMELTGTGTWKLPLAHAYTILMPLHSWEDTVQEEVEIIEMQPWGFVCCSVCVW